MKHTRQWTLKGHTPSDLAARREAAANVLARGGVPKRIVPNAQVHVQNKVGRNEPCTCGSGKKYKKCCGGN
nr:SEC-C metal-binding domain-containing protein [Paenibacillus phyllosphaerae]